MTYDERSLVTEPVASAEDASPAIKESAHTNTRCLMLLTPPSRQRGCESDLDLFNWQEVDFAGPSC
jgi:hypothetical protein